MPFSSDKTRQGAAGVSTGFEIPYSCRFMPTRNTSLTRTMGTPTNADKWVFSCWVKKCDPAPSDGTMSIFYAVGEADISWNANEQFFVYAYADGYKYRYYTLDVYRDPSAWMNIVVAYDSTQGTGSNRVMVYMNGTSQTNWSVSADPVQDLDSPLFNAAVEHRIGNESERTEGRRLDGYLAEMHFIDGMSFFSDTSGTANSSFNIGTFGETGDYGEWKPKEVSGVTYGDNGFYLDFADAADLGDDESGEGNDFAENNIVANDQMLDTPTNNFPTWNPLNLDGSTIALSEGNLKNVLSGDAGGKGTMFIPETGKWYWELNMADVGLNCAPGIIDDTTADAGNGSLGTNGRFTYRGYNGQTQGDGGGSFGDTYTDGDIIGIAFDVDNEALYFAKNGTWQGDDPLPYGVPTSGASKTGAAFTTTLGSYGNYVPVSCGAGGDNTFIINFGQDSSFAGTKTAQGNQDGNSIGDFYYTPPTGFLALCTSNLPAVAVIPQEHFNTVLYTGDGTTDNDITGVGFQPAFVWIKRRSATERHMLTTPLHTKTGSWAYGWNDSADTAAEFGGETDSVGVQTFDSDGFTFVGTDDTFNTNTSTYVSWNWKANGSGASNEVGSINTTATSANADAGFSIITYTGNATSGATIGHGLSKAPEFWTVKRRNSSGDDWNSYHKGIASDAETDWIRLNGTAAASDNAAMWNDQAPTSSVIYLGNHAEVNGGSDTYICYAWHSVDGYSKVGAYTGNDNADGTFVYCGFRPAFVLIKNTVTGGEGFVIMNNKSDPNNPTGTYQTVYSTAAEQGTAGTTFSRSLDFTSNGFKCRGNSTEINDGVTMIFLAFAEVPFKYSNSR